MSDHSVEIISTSAAADLGYLALADLARVAAGFEYRVIGGHMVQLLLHAYPVEAQIRMTADADAGISRAVAAGGHLHLAFLRGGYDATAGNSYQRSIGTEQSLSIDLLTETGADGSPIHVAGRAFDAAPGLRLALSQTPLLLAIGVSLYRGGTLSFEAPVPGVEAALVLKALAWEARTANRDVIDIATILEIAEGHRDTIGTWGLSDQTRASTGSRLDAARALHLLVDQSARGRLDHVGLPSSPRLAALIRKHVHKPVLTR